MGKHWYASLGIKVNGGTAYAGNIVNIYVRLISEIDNDTKQFGMNVAANLVGDALIANNNDAQRRNN